MRERNTILSPEEAAPKRGGASEAQTNIAPRKSKFRSKENKAKIRSDENKFDKCPS